MIEILDCHQEDMAEVMDFIHLHWKQNHILSQDRNLFDWQYKDQEDKINFVIAKEGKELLGILGYIKNSRYDNALKERDVVWLALWKVRENSPAGLGLRLYRKLVSLESDRIIAVNGINKDHSPLYKALGFKNIELNCFFMVNPNVSQNIIKHNQALNFPGSLLDSKGQLRELELSEIKEINNFLFDSDNQNKKTTSYFVNRYLLHPFYKYRLFSILEQEKCLGIISTRLVTHQDNKALRIVDFLGEENSISKVGASLLNLMKAENIEYVDFWQHGIDEELLNKSGFQKLDQERDDIIVPNFFEPFLQENKSILSAVKIDKNQNFIVCKADGDQDRPNILK